MKHAFFGKVATALALAGSIAAQSVAAPLPPGGTVGSFIAPVFPAEPGPVAGSILLTSTTNSFIGVNSSSTVLFTGTLISSVFAGDFSNPFGGLTFTYRLFNDGTSLDNIGEMNLTSFGGFATDVSMLIGSPGLAPLVATRTGTPIPDTKVEFLFKTPVGGPLSFQDNLAPGLFSALLVIQTDAPAYTLGNAAIINGGVASVDTLAPSLIVPEPATMSLALLGLISLGLAQRRN